MSYVIPTPADFQAQYPTDFPYVPVGGDQTDPRYLSTAEIQNAINMASVHFNPAFWNSQMQFTMMYCMLAAHWLVINAQNAATGLSGQFSWLTTHKNVDSVQESFLVPEFVHENPEWAAISKTRYGAQYLSFVMPYVRGTMFTTYDPAHAGS